MKKRLVSVFIDEGQPKLEREIRDKMYAKG